MRAYGSERRLRRATARLAIGLLLGLPPGGAASLAAPVGEQVEHGEASVARSAGTTQITAGDGARIRWDQFGIARDEAVIFVQPSETARVLNLVRSGALPSQLDGSLLANGIVYLVNPAGVFVGHDAVIDVGGLVAAAGQISDADFAAGIDRFTALSGPVENQGRIQAGLLALVGRSVANRGEIAAPAGTIALLAGGEVLLTRPGGRVLVRAEAAPEDPGGFAVENAGRLDAAGGEVVLAAGDLYSLALNHSGIARGERIRLEGGAGGLVRVSGALDAASQAVGEAGGRVEVLGELVSLEGAAIDASGPAGGGEVRIGGELRGGDGLPQARRTYVDARTRISADATQAGDGGSIAVWSEQRTGFFGEASARGGPLDGDGGFVEISGSRLEARGAVDLAAPQGAPGTLLYDPDEIEIAGGSFDGADSDLDAALLAEDVLFGDAGASPFTIYESEIEGSARNITLEAEHRIFASGSFSHEQAGEGSGVLLLAGDLTLATANASAAAGGADGIDLVSGGDLAEIRGASRVELTVATGALDPTGQVSAPIRVPSLASRGGDLIVATQNGSIAVEGAISSAPQEAGAAAGDVAILAAFGSAEARVGDVDVAGDIDARGGDASSGAAGAGGRVFVQTEVGAIAIAGVRSSGGSASAADPEADGGAGGQVVVQSARGPEVDGELVPGGGSVSVGAIDSSGGSALGGAAGAPGDIQVESDLLSSDGANPLVLGGTLTALAGDSAGDSAASITVTSLGNVSFLAAGPHIRTGGDVRLEGDAIGAGNPIRIEGGGTRDSRLDVVAFGPVEVEVPTLAFSDLRVVQAEAAAGVRVTQGDLATPGDFDRIEVAGGAGAATVASIEAHAESSLTLRLDDADPADATPSASLLVPTGSVIARGDVALRSDGDLVLGSAGAAGPAVDASGGGAVILRADFDGTGGGDLRVAAGARSVAPVRAGSHVALGGARIGAAGQPVAVEGTGADALLTVNAVGFAEVGVTGTPFATFEISQGDAAGDVALGVAQENEEGDLALSQIVVQIEGATDRSTLALVDTSATGADFVYRLGAAGATLAVPTGTAFDGEALLESAGDLELGTGPGPAIEMRNASALTLRADSDAAGGGAIRSTGGALDLTGGAAAPGTLFLQAGSGIGTPAEPVLLSGGGSASAESARGGIALRNVGSGELVVRHVSHTDPATGAALEIEDLAGPSEDAVRIRAAAAELVLENAAGDLRLEAPVVTPGAARFLATAQVTLAQPPPTDPLVPNAPIVSALNQSYEAPVEVAADARLRSSGNLSFQEAVDAAVGAETTSTLTLDVAGVLAFGDVAGSDDVGGVVPLASLVTTGAGSAHVLSSAITTSGDQSHGLAMSIAGAQTTFTSQAGDVAFGGSLDGPGSASVGAARRATFDGGVGADTPVQALVVNAPEIDFGSSALVAAADGGIALDPAGRSQVPERATVFAQGGALRFQTPGDFALGRREKLSVPGRLEIAADEVSAGDLSALSIQIDANRYTILGREPGLVRLADGSSVSDPGVDLVANQVVLSIAPEFDGVGNAPQVFASDDGVRMPGGFDVVSLRTLRNPAALGSSDFFGGSAGAPLLDLTGNGGPLVVNPAQEIPRQPPLVGELHAPQRGDAQARFARRVGASDLSARWRGEAVDASRFDDGVLGSERSAEVAADWQALFGPQADPAAAGESLGRAIAEYRRRQPPRDLASVDFRRFLAASPERAPARDFLARLGDLLERQALLPVADDVREALRGEALDEALRALRVEGLTREQLEGAAGAGNRGVVL